MLAGRFDLADRLFHSIGEEWKLSTRQQLLEGTEECPSGDALGVALLQDPRFRLPTRKLPDGKYLGPR